MPYSSPELKLRTLALSDATMQADFGSDPTTFRWYDEQLNQNQIGKLLTAGACARVHRISTIRQGNQGGIGNLSWPLIQIDVLDRVSEQARVVANDVIDFMQGVDLSTNSQFGSPVTGPRANPTVLLNQRQGMIVGPQSPGGPVYFQSMDFRIANLEALSI